MKNHQKKGPIWFQPLTCIRQLGITRGKDGSATYCFVAQVSRDLPQVRITMHVSPTLTLFVGAVFDERLRIEDPQEDDHRRGEGQLSLPLEPVPPLAPEGG